MNKKTIEGTVENWESGLLGLDKSHAKPADPDMQAKVDAALGLQAISIRLPSDLIDTFKHLAAYHAVGYQPLMRDALRRFAESEMKRIMIANTPAPLAERPETPTPAVRKRAA